MSKEFEAWTVLPMLHEGSIRDAIRDFSGQQASVRDAMRDTLGNWSAQQASIRDAMRDTMNNWSAQQASIREVLRNFHSYDASIRGAMRSFSAYDASIQEAMRNAVVHHVDYQTVTESLAHDMRVLSARNQLLFRHYKIESGEVRAEIPTAVANVAAGPAPATKIVMPPGLHADRFLRFALPPKLYARVFKQIVLDMRQEHAEALVAGRPGYARWCHMRGLVAVAVALVLQLVSVVRNAKRAAE
jgi:hypothetical protein